MFPDLAVLRPSCHGHRRHVRPLREDIFAAGKEEEGRDQGSQENTESDLQRNIQI